ncbi:MAG: DUF2945 domain-containing protein [Steroidobacteraceae bacterium]|nr:DUF2945 domain-containing protein [Pseudomonadota bacterium]
MPDTLPQPRGSFKYRAGIACPAGRTSGTIIKVHTRNVSYKGYTHHASEDDPQYEIKSDRTDHIALHKGSALTKKG